MKSLPSVIAATVLCASTITPVFAQGAATPFGGVAARIPGAIQAENFDEGGEGVAFHNIGPVDEIDPKITVRVDGAHYRKTEVEIEIGWGINMLATLREGEWYQYTVKVDETALYDLDAVVASWQQGSEAGAFRIEFDGVDKTGAIYSPNTGRWRDFGNVTVPAIPLEKGLHKMRVVIVAGYNAINLDCFRFRNTQSTPFGGEFSRIPGFIEAENFDEGPESVAFHKLAPAMPADAGSPAGAGGPAAISVPYLRRTPVCLLRERGTTAVTSLREGEWLDYTVQVDSDGLYEVELMVSRAKPGDEAGIIRLDFNGRDKSGPVRIAPSAAPGLYQPIVVPGLKLRKGVFKMRLVNVAGNDLFNIDSFRFRPADNPQ